MKNNNYFILIIILLFLIIFSEIKIKKNNIENFNSKKDCPSMTENEFITPCPTISKIKTCFDINISLNLITINPKYPIENIIVENRNAYKIKNLDWKTNYKKYLCNENCGCDPNSKYGVCLVKDRNNKENDLKYQCPKFCSKCKTCHSNNTKNIFNDLSKCNNYKNIRLKNKCLMYKERIHTEKIYCFFTDTKDINFNNYKINTKIDKSFYKNRCKLFFNKSEKNNYMINDDIVGKINLDYNDKNYKKIKNIEIDTCKLDNEKLDVNVFYRDNKELYFFIETNKKNISKCKLFAISGFVEFHKPYKIKNKKFRMKEIINISDYKISEKLEEKYYEKYINEKKNMKIFNTGILSYNDKNYQDNFLHHNTKIKNCQLNKDYIIYNPNLNMEMDQYKQEKLIDKPETWVNRIDITRPWIFTG